MKSVADILSKVKYQDELKSDEWKSRASSLKRTVNYCQSCRRGDVQLTVHHHNYDPNRRLWEYADSELSVLCWPCHKALHEGLKQFRAFVFGHFSLQSLTALNGALAIAVRNHDALKFAYAVAEMAASPRSVELFAKAFIERPSKNSEVVKRAIEQVAPH